MKKTEFPSLGESLYTEVLPNGLPIFIVPKKGYRKTFAAFATDYGGVDRKFMLGGEIHNTPAGIAHYLEHKMFDMPDGNALVKLEANGASPNAFTSDEMTLYHFECTSRWEENLQELLHFVSTPYFTEESVAKEQGIIGQEIRMIEDSAGYNLYMDMLKGLFSENPIADGVAGTVESIAEITPEVLYNCHKAFYAPSNMALSIVGDVDPEKVLTIAGEVLPAEKAEKPLVIHQPENSLFPYRKNSERKMEVSQPIFGIGLKTANGLIGEALMREAAVSSITLGCMFGRSSSFYSRLYGEGLLNAEFDIDSEHVAEQNFICLSGESKDPEAVLKAVVEQFEKSAEKGLPKDLFERKKKAVYGGKIRMLSSFDSLAESMIMAEFQGNRYFDSFSVLQELSLEDCNRWIREKLQADNLCMSVIRPNR